MNYAYGRWFVECQGDENAKDRTQWYRVEEGGWVLETAMSRCRLAVKTEFLGRNWRIRNPITGEIIMGDVL